MAAEVKSGAANASYVNNTTQNVRLIINYMSNVTSMTWSSSSSGTVNVTASATTIGKNVETYTIRGELRQAIRGEIVRTSSPQPGLTETFFAAQISPTRANLVNYSFTGFQGVEQEGFYLPTTGTRSSRSTSALNLIGPSNNFFISESPNPDNASGVVDVSANLFYVPLTVSRGGNFPVELMLASGQSFSAVCGAFNFVAIREDGN
jgi:hypothetical protein